MSKRLFISRSLSKDSVLQRLEEEGVHVIGESLIEFTPLPIGKFPETDWIFFYSRRGVQYFFEQVPYSTDYEYGVIGPGTAATFYEITGRSPKYTGQSDAQKIADTYHLYEQGKSILFVKARNSLNSVQVLVEDIMQCKELIVYENEIRTDFEIEECDYLCFTSPMNVEAYLQKYEFSDQKIFAIGNSTERKLLELTSKKIFKADQPSESALLDLIISEL